MKLAIMQPYLFPYIGYFQLIKAVDTFVAYDDVNYIKQGWINRNYILLKGKKHLITLELNGASSFKPINRIEIGGNKDKLLKTVRHAYSKAPYFSEAFPVIEGALDFQDRNLSNFIFNSLKVISGYLDITTEFMMSSDIEKDSGLKGLDRGLQICKTLKAGEYINSIGGQELYAKEDFKRHGIDLYFIKTGDIAYTQFDNEFVPNLSVIDVLMFNAKGDVKRMLEEYELIG